MIIQVLGVPQLSRLDALHQAKRAGIRLATLSRTEQPKLYRPGVEINLPTPLRLVYVTEVYVLNSYLDALVQKPQHHLVLLNAPPTLLEEHGVPIHAEGTGAFTFQHILSYAKKAPIPIETRLTKVRDVTQEVYDKFNRDSLLSKLTTLLYRIRNAEERAKASKLSYDYLGSSAKRLPKTGFSFLDPVLASDLASRFRAATLQYTRGFTDLDVLAEEANLDRFELAFVLTRCGHDVGN